MSPAARRPARAALTTGRHARDRLRSGRRDCRDGVGASGRHDRPVNARGAAAAAGRRTRNGRRRPAGRAGVRGRVDWSRRHRSAFARAGPDHPAHRLSRVRVRAQRLYRDRFVTSHRSALRAGLGLGEPATARDRPSSRCSDRLCPFGIPDAESCQFSRRGHSRTLGQPVDGRPTTIRTLPGASQPLHHVSGPPCDGGRAEGPVGRAGLWPGRKLSRLCRESGGPACVPHPGSARARIVGDQSWTDSAAETAGTRTGSDSLPRPQRLPR